MSGRIVIGRALTQGCLLCPLGPWRMALAARKAGLDKGADAAAAATFERHCGKCPLAGGKR